MKKYNLLLLLLFFAIEIAAQSDVVTINKDSLFYRNENGFIVKCHRSRAEGFAFAEAMNPNLYVHNIYYLHKENLMAT